MKKFILYPLLTVLLGILIYFVYTFYLSPSENLQSIYLVPRNAVYIIQTNQPVKSWKKVSGGNVWQHLRKQSYLAELTSSANSLDSLIRSNEKLFDLFGSRAITVSAHVYKTKKYDFLFIVDLEKASKLKFIQDYLTGLGGEGFRISERTYKDHRIFELNNTKTKETLHLTFIKNLLVCSYINSLVEASISEHAEPYIGRDIHFIEMKQQTDHGGLFNIYLQYAWLDDLMRCYLAEEDEYINALSKDLFYTGLNVDMKDDGTLMMKGFTNINDTISSYLKAMLLSGKGKLNAQKIIPQRTAFYMSLSVDNFQKFYENSQRLLKERSAEYQEYEKNVAQIEKFLKISLKDNFINWIGDEISFVQTQPKGLGKDNEFAVIIKTTDAGEAASNLDFLAKQIKKKTPVKFKEVDYKGYPINYLSVKGMFRLILGNFFKKLDKPYYTLVDDYVIFSNHPQTLKNIIDDYLAKRTLSESEEFNTFMDHFEMSSNIFIYVQTPVLHDNLKGFVSAETWQSAQGNKDYITCFPRIGFQMNEKKEMFETRFIAAFKEPIAEPEKIILITAADPSASGEEETDEEESDGIYLDDLDIKRHRENYEDGSRRLEVDIKNGQKHGNYTEYYPNGKVKVKGRYRNDVKDGVFKYYNEEGKMVEKKSFSKGEE